MNIQPDMTKIREDLQEIARLIGPGASYNMLIDSGSEAIGLRMPLGTVLDALPTNLHTGKSADAPRDYAVTVYVHNLFDQIENNHVVISLNELKQDIPVQYVNYLTPSEAYAMVELPFEAVLDALCASLVQ